jgi:hypothetical protein
MTARVEEKNVWIDPTPKKALKVKLTGKYLIYNGKKMAPWWIGAPFRPSINQPRTGLHVRTSPGRAVGA